MFYIKLVIYGSIFGLYTYFVTRPFVSSIDTLSKQLKVEKANNKAVRKDTVLCKKSRDIGTKRFIDFIDDEIDDVSDTIYDDHIETNSTNSIPSWSNAVLGIKGVYDD